MFREFSQSDFRRAAIRGANLVKARRAALVPGCALTLSPPSALFHPVALLGCGYGSRFNPIKPRARGER